MPTREEANGSFDKSMKVAGASYPVEGSKSPVEFRGQDRMGVILQRKTGAFLRHVAAAAIARPTQTICIFGVKDDACGGSLRLFTGRESLRICADCGTRSQCPQCFCEGREAEGEVAGSEEAADQKEFVDTRRKQVEREASAEVHGCEKEELELSGKCGEFVLCRLCSTASKICRGPGLGEELPIIYFGSVFAAIDFYTRHRNFLKLGFIPLPEASYEKRQAEVCPDKTFCAGTELRLRLLNSAFSGKKTYTCAEIREIETRKDRGTKKLVPGSMELEKSGEILYLASGKYSNIGLQAKLKNLTEAELLEVIQKTSPASFFFLAKHKYGTYVIQLIISLATSEKLRSEIKVAVRPYAVKLLLHEIGNYVVQKILQFDVRFVLDCCLSDIDAILRNKIGSRAFKSCTKGFHMYRDEIIPQVTRVLQDVECLDAQRVLRSIIKELTQPPEGQPGK